MSDFNGKIEYPDTTPYERRLYYENMKLHDRIDKAIEYCEKELNDGRSLENQWLMGCYDTCKELLDILKGSDKE